MTDLIVQRVDKARLLLMEARDAKDAKKVADMARAAEVYAKRQRLSEETIAYATAIKTDARVLLGRFLEASEKHKGGNLSTLKQKPTGNKSVPVGTLAASGISKRESSECQRLARLEAEAPEVFERVRTGAQSESNALSLLAKSDRRQAQKSSPTIQGIVSDIRVLIKQGTKFGCIYADPPWRYDNQGTRASTDNHYDTLSVADLCKLPIGELAAEKSHLHLWTTNAFLFECPKLFAAWGFEYKSTFVWVKPQMGIGNYWRNSHEILLLGVRGGLTAASKSEMSWLEARRSSHSTKPDKVRESVMRLSPGPYLELFGRRNVHGWVVFGNAVETQLL